MEDLTADQFEYLKFPVGKFVRGTKAETPERVAACIAAIEALPEKLSEAVKGLSDAQLDTPYRPGGWTVRQVVHHYCDSHMNGVERFKWVLTEGTTTIKAYNQTLWAELADARRMPIEPSLQFLAGMHARWVFLMRTLSTADLQLAFIIPDQERTVTLAEALETYAWHCAHHVAHITRLKEREGW
ncbi:MAG: YfiT family bacillithiol transferase [Flavobacteriales bacterium]